MKTVELVGQVDENHRLTLELPPGFRPGPVKVVVEWAGEGEDPEGLAWGHAVMRLWAEDWSDPREDIYTLEDGKPVDEPR
jgi:hypothetical protein